MDSPSSRRVVINVGGVRFETFASTLLTFPGTRLASLAEASPSEASNYDPEKDEFFYDRNPEVFGSILDYYRTKHLHCSDDVCTAMLEEELSFWEISFTQLSSCCWLKVHHKSQILEDFSSWEEAAQNDEQLLLEARRVETWRGRWQPKVWKLFQKPSSSLAAMCLAAVSLLFGIGAIIIFFEETKMHFSYMMNRTQSSDNEPAHYFQQEMDVEQHSYLLYLELLCAFWFLFEFGTRFFFCPNRRDFVTSLLNWLDFLSLFPAVIELMVSGHLWTMDIVWKILGLVRIVYIMRLFRLVLLIESSPVLRVLSGTLRAITREILILLLILALETLLFATLAFYSELSFTEDNEDRPELFYDIYISCWWAIITLTTVGYGDIYPIRTAGRIVSSLAAICGILTIVLPIPILLIKFQHYYSIALAKERLRVRQKL